MSIEKFRDFKNSVRISTKPNITSFMEVIKMKRNAVIHLELPSEKLLEILLKALLPETKKPATSRSKVSLEGEGKILTMQIKAEDTSAFRATLNSYLRWVALVKDTYKAIINLERRTM